MPNIMKAPRILPTNETELAVLMEHGTQVI
jgi:hypothetical protein